jgi:DNA-binding response OmpR family regulator
MQGDHHGDHHIVIVDGLTVRHQHLVGALKSARGMSVQCRSLEELINNKPDQDEDNLLVDVIVIMAGGETPHQEMTAKIRAAGLTQPLLVLSDDHAAGDDEADEMIRLPVQIGFLLGRIRAHISMYESSEEATLTLGAYVLRSGLRQLILPDGSAVRLTEKEINILRFLHRANGQPVSREVLLAEIWGYNSQISTHTLETHIYRLRQKSEGGTEHLDLETPLLVTDAGGYRLVV